MNKPAQKESEQESRVQLWTCRKNKRTRGRENNLGSIKAIVGGTKAWSWKEPAILLHGGKTHQVQVLEDTYKSEAPRDGAISIRSTRDE